MFSAFKRLRQLVLIAVAEDGETLEAKIAGIINGCSNRETPLRMEDVLLVSELRDNLTSIKGLASVDVDLTFS